MGHIAIFETAQHMGNGIAFADVGQKLVAQPFALGRTPHQSRDIDKGHPRGNDLPGRSNRRQFVQPVIRHSHLAHVRLDGAERKIRRLRGRRPCQRVEKRGLADIRQPDDAHLEAHAIFPQGFGGF